MFRWSCDVIRHGQFRGLSYRTHFSPGHVAQLLEASSCTPESCTWRLNSLSRLGTSLGCRACTGGDQLMPISISLSHCYHSLSFSLSLPPSCPPSPVSLPKINTYILGWGLKYFKNIFYLKVLVYCLTSIIKPRS